MKNQLVFRYSLLLAALLFLTRPGTAQRLPAGPQVLTFFSSTDDTEQPYALYLPKNFKEKKKYPLVVMLHGAGSNHRLALRRVFGKSNGPGETDVEVSRVFPAWKDVDYIVVAPYARGTAGYQGFVEKDVMDMLTDVKKRFRIDEDRTYLTGLSMGGGGTLWLGLSYPDIWAAIAPVCPAPPNGTKELAPNALNLPVHFFHGDADPAVPVAGTREWVKTLKEMGTAVEYKEYPGVQHNSWEKAYADEFIFGWFGQFRRNPMPDRVRFVSASYAHRKAYWVTLEELIPGKHASIDAEFAQDNVLKIKTENLAGFTLHPEGHPRFKPGKNLQVVIDGQNLDISGAGNHLSFSNHGKWLNAESPLPPGSKGPGAEGPVSAAFSDRHIYVYGTADSPSPEALKARMDSAETAADWSAYRGWFLGRIGFYPRIVADKDVRPSDLESSNLILFGTKETNSVIAQFSDKLPMALDADAKDYGLFYVFPLNGHYVAVSSGLAWWTGANPTGWRMMAPAQSSIWTLKDFILFKNSAQTPIAEGYFDKNWKLPAEAASAIQASGKVRMK